MTLAAISGKGTLLHEALIEPWRYGLFSASVAMPVFGVARDGGVQGCTQGIPGGVYT